MDGLCKPTRLINGLMDKLEGRSGGMVALASMAVVVSGGLGDVAVVASGSLGVASGGCEWWPW